jgi:hypothetical protein
MTRDRKVKFVALLVGAFAVSRVTGAQLGATVENWTVSERVTRAVDLSRPVTFVAVTPCRIVDTRDPAGPYGGPILPANTVRDFDLNNGPCPGIPFEVAAYSLNITATQTQGFGDLRVWPTGATPPLVSTLNYVPNQTVANAAIVPADMNGSISIVAAVSGTHLIIDINGYYTDRTNAGNPWYFAVTEPSGRALYVYNTEESAFSSVGVAGQTNSSGNNSFGIHGSSTTFGAVSEVGGVRGVQNPGNFGFPQNYGPAGVRGESRSGFGVLGVTREYFGVSGSNVSSQGLEETWAGLACSATQAVCGMGTLNVTGTKSFVEPHPTDASKVIEYVSLEGPEAGTYFRGRARFTRGIARIPVPENFRMVTSEEGLSIQVTPIGEMATYAVMRIDLNEIVVKASRNVEFFYTVNGVRKGYESFEPTAERTFFVPRSPSATMPSSLSAEAKRKLIANGTYNADGTVNMKTAQRLGWTEKWKGPNGGSGEPNPAKEKK